MSAYLVDVVLAAIGTLLRVSVVLGGAAVVQALLWRRASASSRHLLWTLALLGALLLPVFSAAVPGWTIPVPVAAVAEADLAPAGDTMRRPASFVLESADDGRIEAPREALREAQGMARRGAGRQTAGAPGWTTIVFGSYAAVVLLLLLRLVMERRTARRLAREAADVGDPAWTGLLLECAKRMGVRQPVGLLRSREDTMPMVFGIRRPTILLPAVADEWPTDRRRAVLLHELAHVARHDCLTQLMAAVAAAVYWIHPGVWWITRRLRVERELACDDRVLLVGPGGPEYAEHLLELAYALGGARSPALAVTMARRDQLEGRMLAALDQDRNRSTPGLAAVLAGAAITTAFLVPVSAATVMVVPRDPATTLTLQALGADEAAAGFVDAGFAQRRGASVGAGLEGAGTWEVRPSASAGVVLLRLAERMDSSHSFTIAIERLEGLAPALAAGANGEAKFQLRRDAGDFSFEGSFRAGVGAGTFTFTPSTTFPAELAKRGFARPSPVDQYQLARSDIGFAFIDELNRQAYTVPSLSELVRAAEHGVNFEHLRAMGMSRYRLERLEALVTFHDHGVSPTYISELAAQGLTGLSSADLLRARDHGVSPEFISELKSLGYTGLPLDTLVAARDHGVSPEYIRELRTLGHRFTLAELTRARDHGVSPEYIAQLQTLGYAQLSLDMLVNARDHGLSPEYIGELRQLGYRLTLSELTKARDHGVNAQDIRAMATLGYERLPLESLIRLRDHGVTPEYIRAQTRGGADRLTVDELIERRGRGRTADWRSDRLRGAIERLLDVNVRAMLETLAERLAK